MMKKLLIKTLVSLIVLTFIAQPICAAAAYSGVQPWFVNELRQADSGWGIIPETLHDADLSLNISRGEFCQVALLSYKALHHEIPSLISSSHFSDTTAADVNEAYELGIISGYPDGTFHEEALITRQEMFKILCSLLTLSGMTVDMGNADTEQLLAKYKDHAEFDNWACSSAAVLVSKGIAKGDDKGMLQPTSNTSRAEAIVLVDRILNYLTDPSGSKNFSSSYNGNSGWHNYGSGQNSGSSASGEIVNPLYQLGQNDDKYILIFGSLDTAVYQNAAEALGYMTTIKINVWLLNSKGEKVPGQRSLVVNKAIADTVKAIFEEIYAGPEKFPINSVGGYSWCSSTSEHRLGLAIDINQNENYMIKPDGTIVAGSFWTPGANPYSIPENGDVVNAFHKFGFTWGGNAWRSSNDYMHFSFFGR